MMINIHFALIFLLVSTSIMAASAERPISVDLSKPGFAIQKDAVLNAITKDENYSEISEIDRDKITQTLITFSGKIVGDTSFTALSKEEREQLLEQQKLINKLLAKVARDSKIVCLDEVVSGSNLPKKVCRTRAAHREFARLQREELDKSMNGSNRANTKVSDTRGSN